MTEQKYMIIFYRREDEIFYHREYSIFEIIENLSLKEAVKKYHELYEANKHNDYLIVCKEQSLNIDLDLLNIELEKLEEEKRKQEEIEKQKRLEENKNFDFREYLPLLVMAGATYMMISNEDKKKEKEEKEQLKRLIKKYGVIT